MTLIAGQTTERGIKNFNNQDWKIGKRTLGSHFNGGWGHVVHAAIDAGVEFLGEGERDSLEQEGQRGI